ncbi:hypothetical protein MD484_g4147, partial [Candolleomyces efflorescens]
MRFSILFPVVALAVMVSGHAADEDLSHLSARQLAARQAGIQRRELAARACAPQIAAFERRRIVARDTFMRRQAPPPPPSPPVCPPCPPCGQGFGAQGGQPFGRPGGFPSGAPASAPSGSSASAFPSALASAPSGSPPALPSGSQGSVPPQGSAPPTGQASAPPGTQGSATTSSLASGTTTTGSAQVSASVTPHYTSIQNSTCVLHPEVTEGPYYIRNEFLRNDLREDQEGTTLTLDIGVIDSTTCQPFSNALVEIWSANATGAYGGYSGMQGSPDTVHVDTFLRGGFYTNDQGIVELKTIYPGFYTGRTAHIHTMVHNGWTSRDNGTFVSDSGSLTHIGQFFFEDSISDAVFATSPYTSNTQTRTRNSEDDILSSAGDSSYVSLSQLSDSEYLGYITVVVDSSATYSIMNNNELR